MRWVRGGLLVLVVAGLLLLVEGVTAGSFSGGTSDCIASTGLSTDDFVGTVATRAGSVLTFSTEDGRTVEVTYPTADLRFLHLGRAYHVSAWGGPGDLGSSITSTCGSPGPTSHVDGSSINSGFWAHERLGDHVRWMLGGFVLLGAVVAGFWIHDRWRRPPLTIDGRPRSEVQ